MKCKTSNYHWRQNDFKRRNLSRGYRGNNDLASRYRGSTDMKGYNTGKLVIGCRYEPPKRSHMGELDIWWQTILLGRKESLWARFERFVIGDTA